MNEQEKQQQQINDNLSRIKNKIMILSGKGGVGKSFIAVNIAYGIALRGKKVGILDVDIHGPSVIKMTGLENRKITQHPDNGKALPIKGPGGVLVLSVASLLASDSDAIIWRGPRKYP